MLDICISERSQESNLDRAWQDGLDVARATQAAERIGVALVFGRKETIAVPRHATTPEHLAIAKFKSQLVGVIDCNKPQDMPPTTLRPQQLERQKTANGLDILRRKHSGNMQSFPWRCCASLLDN